MIRSGGILIIGHRGACGYLPEHTLESYRRAIGLGADFIEPDLVATSDGHLIARHEPLLDDTTDVAQHLEFADRKTTRLLDGIPTTGFYTCDFTLDEIKTLRAVQARANRSHEFDGMYEIPTFDEILALARAHHVGVYPETKHPSFHSALGLGLETPLLDALRRHGWTTRDAPVFIQSFETGNLRELRHRTPVRLVQLIDATAVGRDGELVWEPPTDKPYNHAITGDPRGYRELVTPEGLAWIATYADAVGPWKAYLKGSFLADAHRAGLAVHAFTYRNDELPERFAGDPLQEYEEAFRAGVDGVFSDFPDTAAAARERHNNQL
jgi:glycerophosphoryl diester phosphodiesterase